MIGPNRLVLHRAVTVGEFRRMALQRVLDLLRTLMLAAQSRTEFHARRPTTLIQYRDLDALAAAVRDGLRELHGLAGSSAVLTDHLNPSETRTVGDLERALEPHLIVLQDVRTRDGGGLLVLNAFNQLLTVERQYCGTLASAAEQNCRVTADDSHVYFFVTEGHLDRTDFWKQGVEDTRFVASVSELLHEVREADRPPTAAESAIVQAAYEVLARGVAVAAPYRPLGVPGFKPTQTLLMLTDPGEGHLRVTCSDPAILKKPGAAVHIEHIDRDEGQDREQVEPYRLPAPINAAKVRLHVGSAAPCTAYIGRPVFENRSAGDGTFGHYDLDRLKSAHMTAGACTAMFLNGVAECKIGIERMTVKQAIDFMRGVAGNVFRDRHRQYLSAAFNIFSRLYDDRDAAEPRWVEDTRALCGFDKVTWDGANSKDFPSQPVLARTSDPILPHAFWVDLVHEAHAAGLTTYVSAGLEPQHMPLAVYAGLDGIGIGVKLHHFDTATRRMGELKPEAMIAVLDVAAAAQATELGQAARRLAQLDRLRSEKIVLSSQDEDLRGRLLDAMKSYQPPAPLSLTASDDAKSELVARMIEDGNTSPAAEQAKAVLEGLKHLDDIEVGSALENPLVGQIRRLEWARRRSLGFESATTYAGKIAELRAELDFRDRTASDAGPRRPG
jgi:hypothetical protein